MFQLDPVDGRLPNVIAVDLDAGDAVHVGLCSHVLLNGQSQGLG